MSADFPPGHPASSTVEIAKFTAWAPYRPRCGDPQSLLPKNGVLLKTSGWHTSLLALHDDEQNSAIYQLQLFFILGQSRNSEDRPFCGWTHLVSCRGSVLWYTVLCATAAMLDFGRPCSGFRRMVRLQNGLRITQLWHRCFPRLLQELAIGSDDSVCEYVVGLR